MKMERFQHEAFLLTVWKHQLDRSLIADDAGAARKGTVLVKKRLVPQDKALSSVKNRQNGATQANSTDLPGALP